MPAKSLFTERKQLPQTAVTKAKSKELSPLTKTGGPSLFKQ